MSSPPQSGQSGYSLAELLVAVLLAALLFAGLAGVTGNALQIGDAARAQQDLNRQAQFALARIVRMVSRTPGLVLPLADNPGTTQTENIHTAIAILLPRDLDQDGNGVSDADNDKDGRFDEDLPGDMNNDGMPGIAGLDDNLDGSVDNGGGSIPSLNDDEDGAYDEERCSGVDDDGDGNIDEDCSFDMSYDTQPGLAMVDDDVDGQIDEGIIFAGVNLYLPDDDEDGKLDEDWLDTVVYYLDGGQLKERMPVPWDANGDGQVTGKDTVTSVLASNVTLFRVERLPRDAGRAQLVEITLELTGASGDKVSLTTRVQVGGAR